MYVIGSSDIGRRVQYEFSCTLPKRKKKERKEKKRKRKKRTCRVRAAAKREKRLTMPKN